MTAALQASCVVPIPASFDGGDAGTPENDHPVILIAVPDDFPGPLQLDPASPQQYTITFADNDLEDTLYVRIFRDYHKGALGPLDEKPVTNDPINGTVERSQTFLTNNWCNAVAPGDQIFLEVVVSDRPFDPDNTKEPAYQATEGNKDRAHWMATCGVL